MGIGWGTRLVLQPLSHGAWGMGHGATGCTLRTDGHSSVRAARRQADEEKQEEMRLARESAEYAQDPDAA